MSTWQLALIWGVSAFSGMVLAYSLACGWERLSTRRAEKKAEYRLREWRQADNKLTSAFPPYPPVTPDPESERMLIEELMRRLPPMNSETFYAIQDGLRDSGSKLPRSSSVNLGGIPKPSETAGAPSAFSKSVPHDPAGTDGGPTTGWMRESGVTPSETLPSPGASTSTTWPEGSGLGVSGRAHGQRGDVCRPQPGWTCSVCFPRGDA